MSLNLNTWQYDRLKEFVNVSEEFAGSDPEMPGHKNTEARFDKLLDEAKKILGMES